MSCEREYVQLNAGQRIALRSGDPCQLRPLWPSG